MKFSISLMAYFVFPLLSIVHPSILIPSFPPSYFSSILTFNSTHLHIHHQFLPFFLLQPSQPTSPPTPVFLSVILLIFPPCPPLISSCTSFPLLYPPLFTGFASFYSFAPHSVLLPFTPLHGAPSFLHTAALFRLSATWNG